MKSLDKILNSNVSEIGFNKHNNEAYSKLSTIGVTTNSKNFDKFDCDSYISDTNNLKSKKSFGKYISSKDTNATVQKFDFFVISDPEKSNINYLRYEKPIGLQISHESKINDLRLSTLDSLNFDICIYEAIKMSVLNLSNILNVKDKINSIRSNWFIYLNEKVYSEENLQFIYDLGFIGIVINLDKINIGDYKNLKKNLNKIKDSKNGKI